MAAGVQQEACSHYDRRNDPVHSFRIHVFSATGLDGITFRGGYLPGDQIGALERDP